MVTIKYNILQYTICIMGEVIGHAKTPAFIPIAAEHGKVDHNRQELGLGLVA